MSSVAFLSLCLVVVLALLNQVKCEGEMSLEEEALERMKRDAAIELYHRMKRQGSLDVQVGKDEGGKFVLGSVNRQFGNHQVGGNVGWNERDGLNAGARGEFSWDKGRTRFEPYVNVGRGGSSVGFQFRRQFGRRR